MGTLGDAGDNRHMVILASELASITLRNGLIISDFAVDTKDNPFQVNTHSSDKGGWVFSKKSRKKKVVITKKHRIGVKHLTASGSKTTYGKLISLNERELTLETKRKGVLSIPTERISTIKVHKRLGWLGKILGGLGLVTMILLVIGFIIASIVLLAFSLVFSVLTLGGGNDTNQNPGCSPLILLLLIGSITAILLSLPTNIKEPFSSDWEVSGPPVAYYEEKSIDQP